VDRSGRSRVDGGEVETGWFERSGDGGEVETGWFERSGDQSEVVG
jgi:hypothetical protein